MLRAVAMPHLSAMRCLRRSWNHCCRARSVSTAGFRVCQTARLQQTIATPVTRVGVGLHSGERATVKLVPAGIDEGRYFVKERHHVFPALVDHVTDSRLSTCLGTRDGSATVHTVEHLMSALEGLGVDNCRIEISGGSEVPLLDGSAREWVEAIEESGLSVATNSSGASSARTAFVIDAPISVSHGDAFVAAFPSPFTRLTYGIDFPQVPAIGSRWFSWSPTGSSSSYKDEVAPARTFGIAEQLEELRGAGLIRGGSLENALVCSMDKGWLNPPLRFDDEPCRHKMLDLIGDLALCASPGHPGLPVAHVVAFKASHALHVKFGAALLRRRVKCSNGVEV